MLTSSNSTLQEKAQENFSRMLQHSKWNGVMVHFQAKLNIRTSEVLVKLRWSSKLFIVNKQAEER